MSAAVGDLCQIESTPREAVLAETIGFDRGLAQIMPFHPIDGLKPETRVVSLNRKLRVPSDHRMLGRVFNGLCQPIDGRGPFKARRWTSVLQQAPTPMGRPKIDRPFVTGQRVIDGLVTCGVGQRVALLAGSGVGKSSLLGDIAKGAESDLNVIAMIGERGREVQPFLDDCLGPEGLKKSIVIVSTSDQPPLMRVRAAQVAVTVADDFRRQGANVLFLLDSVTRMAMAQREIGLLLGEPPSARGYTPSVFQLLPQILEKLGRTGDGAITGILTVLVEGDDVDDPISDSVRSIVDGHIVLDRTLAEKGHFPAVDAARSVSRVQRDVAAADHLSWTVKIREIIATFAEVSDLVRIGAYEQGSSPKVDRALQLMPAVETFLKQQIGTQSPLNETKLAMRKIADAWQF
jgi:flagellum-specific ATP synthase